MVRTHGEAMGQLPAGSMVLGSAPVGKAGAGDGVRCAVGGVADGFLLRGIERWGIV